MSKGLLQICKDMDVFMEVEDSRRMYKRELEKYLYTDVDVYRVSKYTKRFLFNIRDTENWVLKDISKSVLMSNISLQYGYLVRETGELRLMLKGYKSIYVYVLYASGESKCYTHQRCGSDGEYLLEEKRYLTKMCECMKLSISLTTDEEGEERWVQSV